MQSIVVKVVVRKTHINDGFNHIQDKLYTLTDLMSDYYLPKRASEFLQIPMQQGGRNGGIIVETL